MKKYLLALALLGVTAAVQAQTGIGTITPDASAQLDVSSITKGLLAPRMTATQRNAMTLPATGLVIFNTTSNNMEVNTGTPAAPVWTRMAQGSLANTALTSSTAPAGINIGDMVYNTNASSGLPIGPAYWDGTKWVSVAPGATPNVTLTSSTAPAGNSIGQVAYNTGTVQPTGLVYWDGAQWKSINNANSVVLTSATSPAGASIGQTMYNTGSVQPTGLVYWDGTKWVSVSTPSSVALTNSTSPAGTTLGQMVYNTNAASGVPVGPTYWDGTKWVSVLNSATPNIYTTITTFNKPSIFNDTATFNSKAIFNDTVTLNSGVKLTGLPQGLTTDSVLCFDPVTKLMRRISMSDVASMTKNIVLTDNANPAGNTIGQVAYNTGTVQPTGLVYWDGAQWNSVNTPTSIALTGQSAPTGATIGQMVYNTNAGSGLPVGPVYWDGTQWVPVGGNTNTSELFTNGTPPVAPYLTGDKGVIYTDTATISPTLGNQFIWDGTQFVTYTPSNSTEFYSLNTANDAGSAKATGIYRPGQMGLGTNDVPDQSAMLDVNSTTQGFLPPRMLKAQMNAIVKPADGLIVYCTDCTPRGPYYYDSTTTATTPAWVSMGATVLPAATFTASSIACTGTLAGTYTQGVAMTSTNTKTVTITVATIGTYTASTNTVNGVTFSASGTLVATGAGVQIKLTASGTPVASGAFTYTTTITGQTCTFSVTYALGVVVNCSGTVAGQLSPLTDVLTNGQAYTATVAEAYSSGTGAAYGTTTVTQSGLTLTRTAGTYAVGGGTVSYTMSGTYTGTTGPSAVTFTLPEGCTVQFTGLNYSSTVTPGTSVTFGNLKAMVPSSGNASLMLATTTGTVSADYNSYTIKTGTYRGYAIGATNLTTSFSYVNSAVSMAAGGLQVAYVQDLTGAHKEYKISLVMAASNKSLIRFERVDTSSSPTIIKAGIVNSGQSVSLDNIKITAPGSSPFSAQISTVSGSLTAHWAGHMSSNGNNNIDNQNSNQSVTTSPQTIHSDFVNTDGVAIQEYFIYDVTNNKYYKVDMTYTTAAHFTAFIRIERMDVSTAMRKGTRGSMGTSSQLTGYPLIASLPASGAQNLKVSSSSGNITANGGGYTMYYTGGPNTNCWVPNMTITSTPAFWAGSGDLNNMGAHAGAYIYDSINNLWYHVVAVGSPNSTYFMMMLERY